ncbi:MAG: nitroreductase family protein [Clostridia bacterium]|nr:nitroreductase family protein [Clostridia bacterium]
MNFNEIAQARQSCRKYDTQRIIEKEKLDAVLETARLAPSACNSQPYHLTVCRGETVKRIARAKNACCEGINDFVADADALIVISEQPVVVAPVMVERMEGQNFRDIDIGILAAYITAEATAQGLGSCIVGLFDDLEIRRICGLDTPVRLLITLGYEREGNTHREKRRKALSELTDQKECD